MKKRVRHKNHKLLIKKKNSKWIILNNDRFLLTVLLVAIVIAGLFVTFNAQTSQSALPRYSGGGELAESSTQTDSIFTPIFNSQFYKDFIKPYVVPEDLSTQFKENFKDANLTEAQLFLIGFFILLILFVIIYDIFSLIPIFSPTTMKLIAFTLGLIMLLTKVNISVAAMFFAVGIKWFAYFGELAVFFIIIFAILILIGLFFGGNWVIDHMVKIRAARDKLEKVRIASIKGARIAALEAEAEAAK